MATQEAVGVGTSVQVRHGFEDRLMKALAGVEKYIPATSSLTIHGKAMTQPEVVQALQDVLGLFQNLRDMRNAAKEQLKTVRSELVPGHALYSAVEGAVKAYFGKGSPTLAQFGYALGNRKPRTGATNVKAQAKSQLTRALRHTMGPKQKASIQADAPQLVTVSLDGKVLPEVAAPVGNQTGGSDVVQPTRSAARSAPVVSPSGSAGAEVAQVPVK